MSWHAISALSEIVGAVAVVVSLIYLAVQIRTGTRDLRSNTQDAVFHRLIDWNETVMGDPELVRIFRTGSRHPDLLDENEEARYGHIMFSFFKLFENIILHHFGGSVDPGVWKFNQPMLLIYANPPGGQYYLNRRKEIFDPRFFGYLRESRINEDPAPKTSAPLDAPRPEKNMEPGT